MATVYTFKIKTVSAFCAHPKDEVKKIIQNFLDTYKFQNGLGFENTEITEVYPHEDNLNKHSKYN